MGTLPVPVLSHLVRLQKADDFLRLCLACDGIGYALPLQTSPVVPQGVMAPCVLEGLSAPACNSATKNSKQFPPQAVRGFLSRPARP